MNPGEEIKKLRGELNLSQKRFGEKVGISSKTISAYETGRIIPPLKVMEKIAKTYNFGLGETPTFMTNKKALEAIQNLQQQLKELEQSLRTIV